MFVGKTISLSAPVGEKMSSLPNRGTDHCGLETSLKLRDYVACRTNLII